MSTIRPAHVALLVAALVACNDQADRSDSDVAAHPDAGEVGADASEVGADGSEDVLAIDVSIVTCDKEDDFSPNHGPEEALLVEGGTLEAEALYVCSGEDDWFEIEAHAGQTLSARIEFADRIGDLDLYVLPAGTTDLEDAIALSASREDIESLAVRLPTDGSWFVVIDSFEGAVGVYDLSIGLSCASAADCPTGYACSYVESRCLEEPAPTCGSDRYEPNDSPGAAAAAEVGGDGFAFLHGLRVCDEDDDYFALTFDEPTTLNAELEFNVNVDLDLYVFDSVGAVVGAAVSQGESPEVLALPMLPSGTYYVAVDAYDAPSGSNVDYNLTLETAAEGCRTNLDCSGEGRALCEAGACIAYVPETPNGPGGACDDDTDCAGDLQCYGPTPGIDDNICTSGCRNDSDCSMFDDGYCLGFGRSGVCYGSCATDSDCPTYYSCSDAGRCELIECRVDADCGTDRVCRRTEQQNSGFCTDTAFAGCRVDDEFEENDTEGSAASLSEASSRDLLICDRDDDWYAIDIEESGTTLRVAANFDTDADIDVFILAADGRTVGYGAAPDANPERADARSLGTGTYFVRVNQFPGDRDVATGYSLSFETIADPCTVDGGECLGLEPLRIVCDEDAGGVCEFFDGDGSVALGGACDSSDDCDADAHFCWTFEPATEGNNICTIGCEEDPDCSEVPGTTCHVFGRGFGACLPG